MRIITFASYKGGVGRSLALANLAHYLAELGQRVVALDLDLESPGLHYKLGPELAAPAAAKLPGGPPRRPAPRADLRVGGAPARPLATSTARGRPDMPPDIPPDLCPDAPPSPAEAPPGALDLLEAFIAHRPLPLGDALTEIHPRGDGRGAVYLVSAGAEREGYWQRLALFPWRRLLSGAGAGELSEPSLDHRAAEALLAVRDELEVATGADTLLIDTGAGAGELSDLATSLLADDVVLLSANNHESRDGSVALVTALTAARQHEPGGPAPRIFPVLARLPALPPADERALTVELEALLSSAGGPAVQPVSLLHHSPALAMHEHLVLTVSAPGADPLADDYLQLFAKLAPASALEPMLRARSEAALRQAYDDPAAGARAVEALARLFPHPVTLRAALKHRRLTARLSAATLTEVARLAALTGDLGEPLLGDIVVRCAVAATGAPLPADLLELIERVWNAQGRGWELGVSLARALAEAGAAARARDVLCACASALRADEGQGAFELLRALTAIDRGGAAPTANGATGVAPRSAEL